MLTLGVPRAVLSRADLSGNAKVVWIALQAFVAADGYARPRLVELQQATGLPDKTLRDALRLLVDRRLLVADRMLGGVTGFRYAEGGVRRISPDPATIQQEGGPADFTGPPSLDCPFPAASSQQGPADFTGPPSPNTTTEKPSSSSVVEGGAGGRARKPRRIPTTLPADWTPGPTSLAYARDHKPGIDVSAELVRFHHWWTEGSGAGTKRADWEGTFLNWLGRARPAALPTPAYAPAARPQSGGMAHLLNIVRKTG